MWINMPETPHPAAYMGGVKESGIGGEMGVQGLLSYAYTKSLHISKL